MRFSERHGYLPIREVVQSESMDDFLKNSLWSALTFYYWNTAFPSIVFNPYSDNAPLYNFCASLWINFFRFPLDTLDSDWPNVLSELRDRFFSFEWYEVYDFVEFVPDNFDDDAINQKFREVCNNLLEREMSAYRFVDNIISPVVAEEEIESIENAADVQQDAVREHLSRALSLMSDRKSPDFRNSIKESICAVEALVRNTLGEKKGTLGKLLERFGEEAELHPALKDAFSKLYGYTSDESGIRHALLEKSNLDFVDAKFMLVACSAFINYVIAKKAK